MSFGNEPWVRSSLLTTTLFVTSVFATCADDGGCDDPVGSTAERAMREASIAQDKALREVDAWINWTSMTRASYIDPVQRMLMRIDAYMLSVTLLVMVVCSLGALSWPWRRTKDNLSRLRSVHESRSSLTTAPEPQNDASSTDPGLLKKHSKLKSYTITVEGRSITYPAVRTFYHPHPQAAKLPTSPTTIPLLVFIHGLGGSVAQFNPLLTSLVNVAPCLAIDLPGCGMSGFEPRDWDAYKLETLAELVGTAIQQHRDDALGQEVVLIGHSLGCSLSVLLASSSSPVFAATQLRRHIVGVIAICPRAEPPSKKQVATFRKLLKIPGPIFDLWRTWDKRGGIDSASVARFVGMGAEEETKKLQVRFNQQSKTPVWRRMASGTLPDYSKHPRGGLPGKEAWQGLRSPALLIAGEADRVTPAAELDKIAGFLGKTSNKEASEESHESETLTDAAAPIDTGSEQAPAGHTSAIPLLSEGHGTVDLPLHKAALKTTILPSPAAHALLYAPSTVRIIAGLIQSFLADHIDPRLSLGWQLQYLTTEGKWDVKNLVKWQKVQCVSDPIPGVNPLDNDRRILKDPFKGTNIARDLIAMQTGTVQRVPVFRAMKTLREVDDVHSPAIFVQQWRDRIKAVIDISHESPVYSPRGLEKGGIQYYKFPTVSKLPPTADEVSAFITLIDRLCSELHIATSSDADKARSCSEDIPVIGVHCHYGFNRTGFFLVSYLVERLGFRLQDAIDEFERQRPPGIRHGHFIDALFVRYCVGLKRAPTL